MGELFLMSALKFVIDDLYKQWSRGRDDEYSLLVVGRSVMFLYIFHPSPHRHCNFGISKLDRCTRDQYQLLGYVFYDGEEYSAHGGLSIGD